MNKIILSLILVLIEFIGVLTVPHEFCEDPFDDGDCGESPTPVFYYYKPGSRCEIRTWRGCPTLNQFPDEYLCSYYCIGRLMGRADEGEHESFLMPETNTIKNDLIEEIQALTIEDIQIIDEIINKVVLDNKIAIVYPSEHETEETNTEQVTEKQKEDVPKTTEPSINQQTEEVTKDTEPPIEQETEVVSKDTELPIEQQTEKVSEDTEPPINQETEDTPKISNKPADSVTEASITSTQEPVTEDNIDLIPPATDVLIP